MLLKYLLRTSGMEHLERCFGSLRNIKAEDFDLYTVITDYYILGTLNSSYMVALVHIKA